MVSSLLKINTPEKPKVVDQFVIFNWCGEKNVNEVAKKLGYEHNQVCDEDIFVVAQKFYANGINVMISKNLLALDTKLFRQR